MTKGGKSVLGAWAWELGAVACSALCLAGLVGVLVAYDGRPVLTWKGVTLNAVVSVLSTASKASLLVAVGELISQWKWILFPADAIHARPLMDFQRVDSASRGVLGSLQLLWCLNRAWTLRLGALVVLLYIAVDPFSQQLVQLRQAVVYTTDPGTVTAVASRYSKGSWFRQELVSLDPSHTNATTVKADADFSMQSAVLFGLDQPLRNVVQQGAFRCPTANCTWPPYESLAVCKACNDISNKLERHSTQIGLYGYLETDNGAVAVRRNGNTAFRLPNDLFIENDNGWVYAEEIDKGKNEAIFGAVMMTSYGTANASETVSMRDLDTLIWSMSMIRVTGDPKNATAAWPDVPHTATECALFYCVNKYEAVVEDGVRSENATRVKEAVRAPDSWRVENPPEELSDEVRESIEFHHYWSFMRRTDLSLMSPGTGSENNTARRYNLSQAAVNGIGSYISSTFAGELQEINVTHAGDRETRWRLNGFYMSSGQVQYSPSTMQVLFRAPDLDATFTSLAASMTNSLRDSSDGPGAQAVGERGVLTTFYKVQWPWISLHCVSLCLGLVFFALTLARNRAPTWKSSSLAVMARGHQLGVTEVVGVPERVKEMGHRAKWMRVEPNESLSVYNRRPVQTGYGPGGSMDSYLASPSPSAVTMSTQPSRQSGNSISPV